MKSTSYIIFGIPVAILLFVIGCMIYVRAGRVVATDVLTLGGDVMAHELPTEAPIDSLSIRLVNFEGNHYYDQEWLNVEISVDPAEWRPAMECSAKIFEITDLYTDSTGVLTLTVDLTKLNLTEREVNNLDKVEFPAPLTLIFPQMPRTVSVDEGKVDLTLYNLATDNLKYITREGSTLNLRNASIGNLNMRVWGNEYTTSAIWDNSSIGTLNLQMVRYAYVSIESNEPSTADRVIVESLPTKRDTHESPRVSLPGLKVHQLDNRSTDGLTLDYRHPFSATFSE